MSKSNFSCSGSHFVSYVNSILAEIKNKTPISQSFILVISKSLLKIELFITATLIFFITVAKAFLPFLTGEISKRPFSCFLLWQKNCTLFCRQFWRYFSKGTSWRNHQLPKLQNVFDKETFYLQRSSILNLQVR